MSFYSDVLKNASDSLDRKEKDFALWSLKFSAAAGDAKFTHEHKLEGADVAKTKIEMSSLPFPGLESFKGSHEQDRSKFIKSIGSDFYSHNGNKANMTVKWTWTPKTNTHAINSCKKVETEDLGGFRAFIKNEIDVTHESGKDQKFDIKGSLVMKGDEWKAGVAGEMLQESNKAEALATYNCCSNAWLWANVQAEFPQKAHNKLIVGAAGNVCGIEHLAQLTLNMAGEKDGAKVDYKGFMDHPVDLQMGCNWKASDATNVEASVKWNKDMEYHSNVSHKIDSHLTAKFHQHFFSNRIGGEKAPVDCGFEFSYKL